MLKKVSYLSLAIAVIFALTLVSCEEDPEETCGFDDFCEVEITSCCTDETCVYKYNGKEYADTEAGRKQLIDDIGCSATAIDFKSAQEDDAEMERQLKAFLERVRDEHLGN